MVLVNRILSQFDKIVDCEYLGWRSDTHNVEKVREEPAGSSYEVIRLQH